MPVNRVKPVVKVSNLEVQQDIGGGAVVNVYWRGEYRMTLAPLYVMWCGRDNVLHVWGIVKTFKTKRTPLGITFMHIATPNYERAVSKYSSSPENQRTLNAEYRITC